MAKSCATKIQWGARSSGLQLSHLRMKSKAQTDGLSLTIGSQSRRCALILLPKRIYLTRWPFHLSRMSGAKDRKANLRLRKKVQKRRLGVE
jgi:hypothetical protein